VKTEDMSTTVRELTPDEISLISGGSIVVYAYSYNMFDNYWYWPEEYSYYDYREGDSSGYVAANETPCVEAAPNAISMPYINDAALAASQAIAQENDETFEYSSILWALDGAVGWTTPWTDGLTDSVNLLGGLDQVPEGAVIVGIVHNHPDDPAMNDRIPSGAGSAPGGDWAAYDEILGLSLPRGITVDQNMLLYIYSNEDQKTHVYDKTDKSQTTASCSLQ